MKKILFVCTANICRSPTAHAIFQKLVNNHHLFSSIEVDSAGTHGIEGEIPDSRSSMIARKNHVNLSNIRSRALTEQDFDTFDHILIMDNKNLDAIKRKWPNSDHSKVRFLLEHGDNKEYREVPDPYRGEAEDFILAYQLIEQGCLGLIEELERELDTDA